MVFRGKCDVCGGSDFNVEDGYYYCSECNTQNRNIIEIECDVMDLTMGDEKIRVKGVKLKGEKENKVELTSWEEYNYILLGLVNEAMALGAPVALKKTVLQLWTRYLQKINAAFFSSSEAKLPKLSLNFFRQDAAILYNVSKKRPRSVSSATNKSSASPRSRSRRVLKIARTKSKKALMKRSCDTNSSKQAIDNSFESQSFTTNTSEVTGSKTTRTSMSLEFTSQARKAMKKTMNKKHIKKHADDAEYVLKCHRKKARNTENERLEKVSKNVLLSLLYIGLNQTKSEIQLGDMIRFTREAHLSIFNVNHFFPDNILKYMNKSTFVNFTGPLCFPQHRYIRQVSANLCKRMNVKDVVMPDLVRLSMRYVQELCLPNELGKFLERLITFHPPEMPLSRIFPNYEARAVAYVIFLLKWLFGLDGRSEEVMSGAAQEVNKRLSDENIHHELLFDFEEWTKYIEMRCIILTEYHEPTYIAMGMPGGSNNAQRYLDFLNHCSRPEMKSKKSIGNYVHQIYETLTELHGEDSKRKSYLFSASFTPFKTYMDYLLDNHSHELNIPEFMTIDHSKRVIDPFLRPHRFQNQLRMPQFSLSVEVCPENLEMIYVDNSKRQTTNFLAEVKIVKHDEESDYCLQEKHRNGKKKSELSQEVAFKRPRGRPRKFPKDTEIPQSSPKVNKKISSENSMNGKILRSQSAHSNVSGTNDNSKDAVRSSKSTREISEKLHDKTDQRIENSSEQSNDRRITRSHSTRSLSSKSTSSQRMEIVEASTQQVTEPTETQEVLTSFLENHLDSLKKEKNIFETSSHISFESPKDTQWDISSGLLSADILSEKDMNPGKDILRFPRRKRESITMFDDMSDEDDAECPPVSPASHQIQFFTPHFKYWHHFIARRSWDFIAMREEEFQEMLDKLPPSFTWLLRQCSIITGIKQMEIYIELQTIEKQFTGVLESVDKMTTMLLLREESRQHPSYHFQHIW
ncbi:TATA box-binding protein-associated factor RNA polymerase I subunit B [Phlebotomus argentipes]|uniref:TATA box-binding protein-associated factor RNA polymerase I subunit B n=1 Tax=Phlebotomus argentipes TaxID=94469 RepID=UPI0028938044|nr:TATA box-binding protein-associated factor RNA polymerase I subunit B [Phlebotomus argentipes]